MLSGVLCFVRMLLAKECRFWQEFSRSEGVRLLFGELLIKMCGLKFPELPSPDFYSDPYIYADYSLGTYLFDD